MDDTVKYLIHADVTADGVVERSDVVGAIFGQTEGLLGDELDLRSLQQASKVGRIDVEIESEQGQSFGHLTIETSLDKVATATLGAALETITRIGPCRAKVAITEIEDVRAAKRREVVERAKELLTEGFSDTVMSSEEILSEVRERVRVEDITEYEGLPAGPRVHEGDSVIVVEGRADVLTLLQYGIKNAVAVEGTNVPDPVASLTGDRTVTVFLDGDRGGDLILEELSQVGDIDYVAFAPPGQSVEDLDRGAIYEALQNKVPYDAVAGMSTPRDAVAATDGSAAPAPPAEESAAEDGTVDTESTAVESASPGGVPVDAPVEDRPGTDPPDGTVKPEGGGTVTEPAPPAEGGGEDTDPTVSDDAPDGDAPDDHDAAETEGDDDADAGADDGADEDGDVEEDDAPGSVRGHVEAVIGEGTGLVRLLDDDFSTLAEGPAEEAFDLVEGTDPVPTAVVIDGAVDQRVVDVAAQRGVEQVVARELGAFTKRPTGVRLRTADQMAIDA